MTRDDIERAMVEIAEAEYINEQIYGPAQWVVVVKPELVPLYEWVQRHTWPKTIIHDLPNEVLHGLVKGY